MRAEGNVNSARFFATAAKNASNGLLYIPGAYIESLHIYREWSASSDGTTGPRDAADAADGAIDVSDNVKEKKRKNVVRS